MDIFDGPDGTIPSPPEACEAPSLLTLSTQQWSGLDPPLGGVQAAGFFVSAAGDGLVGGGVRNRRRGSGH